MPLRCAASIDKRLRLGPGILEMVGLATCRSGPPDREQEPRIDLRIEIDERRLALVAGPRSPGTGKRRSPRV